MIVRFPNFLASAFLRADLSLQFSWGFGFFSDVFSQQLLFTHRLYNL